MVSKSSGAARARPTLECEKTRLARFIVKIEGAVQGVGFRPFVYRMAEEFGIKGWVANDGEGVVLEAEASEDRIRDFLNAVDKRKPPLSHITKISVTKAAPLQYNSFEIKQSKKSDEVRTIVLPDIATCAECMAEVNDPNNRRHRYPFTNCTNCGPRFSIIQSLPYDRPRTTMSKFELCPDCQKEYTDARDRRFHAQPIACPVCGPTVWLTERHGKETFKGDEAIRAAASEIRAGKVVAMKGLGGFLLLCDATAKDVVAELRRRKHREEKPFAVMMLDLLAVEAHCLVGEKEREVLTSPSRPIVLLRKRNNSNVVEEVAPKNPFLGVMLPYTPLHHLVAKEAGVPLVATSGNLSDEPIAKDNEEALERLHDIADFFLLHNRDIERRIDDSVVKVVDGKPMPIRRARGYSPTHVRVPGLKGRRILALGGHLKNTVAIAKGGEVIVSQHVGDLDTKLGIQSFHDAVSSMMRLYKFEPDAVAVDMHPRYISSQWGRELGPPVTEVQHHHAHIVSCMAEHSLDEPALGVAWDGVGYGTDGKAWGSEFMMATRDGFSQLGHINGFPLPGGESSVHKPWKSALGLLWETFGDEALEVLKQTPLSKFLKASDVELNLRMIKHGVNSPRVRGVGRVFDSVASILGVRHVCSFEGQAAMELEGQGWMAFEAVKDLQPYDFQIKGNGVKTVSLRELVSGVVHDIHDGLKSCEISLKFHLTLAEVVREFVSGQVESGIPVVLSGGVFQSSLLTMLVKRALAAEKTHIYTHHIVPPNDGGISLGQAVIADAGAR